MDQQQQSRWQPTRRQFFWAGGVATLAFLIIVICGYLFGWKWTGLVTDANYPKRALWDWLDLLIIPVVLAIGGYLFTRSENRAAQLVAEQRTQDEALQAYLDQMGQMLLDKDMPLRQSKEGDEVRTLARARTLTMLARLDGPRKGSVVQFLYESGLVNRDRTTPLDSLPIVNLKRANLRGAILSKTNLELANLYRADLSRAELQGAVLSQTSFYRADLKRADLRGADLRDAILYFAELEGANLLAAKVTGGQLDEARSLEGATMPNGQTYEEWVKSREEGDSGS